MAIAADSMTIFPNKITIVTNGQVSNGNVNTVNRIVQLNNSSYYLTSLRKKAWQENGGALAVFLIDLKLVRTQTGVLNYLLHTPPTGKYCSNVHMEMLQHEKWASCTSSGSYAVIHF